MVTGVVAGSTYLGAYARATLCFQRFLCFQDITVFELNFFGCCQVVIQNCKSGAPTACTQAGLYGRSSGWWWAGSSGRSTSRMKALS